QNASFHTDSAGIVDSFLGGFLVADATPGHEGHDSFEARDSLVPSCYGGLYENILTASAPEYTPPTPGWLLGFGTTQTENDLIGGLVSSPSHALAHVPPGSTF
ncbi:hypothetical protein LTR80_012094, partial [Exophiala xenobiotica]